jgi:hypothetical protein
MRFVKAAALLLLVSSVALAADKKSTATGTMKIDGKSVTLVDGFAYTGERTSWDEEGTRLDNYNIVLTAARYDHAAVEKSTEPVGTYNEWLYGEEPATLDIHVRAALDSEYAAASAKGEYHSKPLRCYCDGIVSELKLAGGRITGRIYSPKGLESRHEGEEGDPSAGRKLEFDVTVDLPVFKVSQ